MNKPNKPLLRKWVKALESGRYKQVKNKICDISPSKQYSYCCLGVLGRVTGLGASRMIASGGILDRKYWNKLDLGIQEEQYAFTDMNDLRGMNFKEIAGYIKNKYLKRKK